jgi:predicted negative regulator of RcsB-dependent stress response
MASRNQNAPVVPRLADDDSIGDWIVLHKTTLGWAALAVAVIVGGGWFYERSQALKAERAEKAYYSARQEAALGNAALAAADLKKLAERYPKTRAGIQGRISLAQLDFDQKKFKEGIAELKSAEQGISSGDDFAPSVHLLEANGYEELKDFVNAADQYRLAAETSRFPNDQGRFRAYQARALTTAGKRAEALAIWEDLAKDQTSPFALEAKLRIGELEATPAKA